ncbi:blast:Sun domain-containing protein 1 [Drosophila guanche]|nr:blast:Sun domain-containing protein 1 [Drosophila guanche]
MSKNTMKNSGLSDLRQEVKELSKMIHGTTGTGPPGINTVSGPAPQSDQKSIGPALTKCDSDVLRKVDGLIEDVKTLKQECNQMNSMQQNGIDYRNFAPNANLMQNPNGMPTTNGVQGSNSEQYPSTIQSPRLNQDSNSNYGPNSYQHPNGINSQYSHQDPNSYQDLSGINSQYSNQYPNSGQDPRSNQHPGTIHSSSSLQNDQTYCNRLNFASDKLGARVVSVRALPIERSSLLKRLLALDFSSNPPVNMLQSSLAPGACFGYRGNQSTVTIHLANAIIVETITLSHTSKDIIPSNSASAPKDFEVFGMKKGSSKRELLGQFTYNNDALRRTEIYNVDSRSVFQLLVFDFYSNHGSDCTCIYRLEVYGYVPDPESEGNTQVDDAGKEVSCGKGFCGEGEICEQAGCSHRNNTGDGDSFGSEEDISGPTNVSGAEDPGEPEDALVENNASESGEDVSGQGDQDRGQICGLNGAACKGSGCIPCHTEL